MSEAISNVDQNNFQQTVLDSVKPVLVDFWAEWCGPCKAIAPVVEELSKEYTGKVEFAKVNIYNAPILASNYGVMSIPTLIVFKDGKPASQVIGFKSKDDLKKLLNSALTE